MQLIAFMLSFRHFYFLKPNGPSGAKRDDDDDDDDRRFSKSHRASAQFNLFAFKQILTSEIFHYKLKKRMYLYSKFTLNSEVDLSKKCVLLIHFFLDIIPAYKSTEFFQTKVLKVIRPGQ